MKKICIVTGTRAEYGLLKPIIKKIQESKTMELHLVVTGSHLSPEFGKTYQEIESDGFVNNFKIEMLMSSDTSVGITKSMGVCLIGLADCFNSINPDMVIILGDRYEMLMAATAAMIARIPIAHIGGGEITEGAYDDAIRHSITKMSQLHFAATEEYRNRIIQLGEKPERVYNVGALGVENTKKVLLWTKTELEKDLQFEFDNNTVIITYHPVTLDNLSSQEQFANLLKAMDKRSDLRIIFTKANADTDGRVINQMIDEYVDKNKERCVAFTSLGQVRYLSALQFCKAVIGNSSSGIIEVPSFHKPTVNIGNRQQGRIAAESVIHCGYSCKEIETAMETALSKEFNNQILKCKNPYEGDNTSSTIIHVIKEFLDNGIGVKKQFYDLININHI